MALHVFPVSYYEMHELTSRSPFSLASLISRRMQAARVVKHNPFARLPFQSCQCQWRFAHAGRDGVRDWETVAQAHRISNDDIKTYKPHGPFPSFSLPHQRYPRALCAANMNPCRPSLLEAALRTCTRSPRSPAYRNALRRRADAGVQRRCIGDMGPRPPTPPLTGQTTKVIAPKTRLAVGVVFIGALVYSMVGSTG